MGISDLGSLKSICLRLWPGKNMPPQRPSLFVLTVTNALGSAGSDAPLDMKVKASMISDMLTLIGEYG